MFRSLDTEDVFIGLRSECGKLDICTFKETGCGNCVIHQTLIDAEKALEERKRLKEIGAIEELQVLKERDTAKEPGNSGERIPFSYYCPNCNEELSDDGYKPDYDFCPSCGQRILNRNETSSNVVTFPGSK